jgi:hypothetical protein
MDDRLTVYAIRDYSDTYTPSMMGRAGSCVFSIGAIALLIHRQETERGSREIPVVTSSYPY